MLNRRTFLATATVFAATPVFAATKGEATAFVDKVTTEIMGIVNSNTTTASAVKKFNALMGKYADMPTISRSVLGPAARTASNADLNAFSKSLQGYLPNLY